MKKELGDKIRIQRISKGLSQENMAAELGISNGAYSNIERGKTDITVTRLYQIANLLQIGIYEFLPQVKPTNRVEDPLITDISDLREELREELRKLKAEIGEIKGGKNYPISGAKRKK